LNFIDRVTPEQTGTHYPATSNRIVMSQTIPLPPLAEQCRIVTAVERIVERASAAHERLERVRDTLERFRLAVLASACSGQLIGIN
jgi:type I restriction enzyme S subunit